MRRNMFDAADLATLPYHVNKSGFSRFGGGGGFSRNIPYIYIFPIGPHSYQEGRTLQGPRARWVSTDTPCADARLWALQHHVSAASMYMTLSACWSDPLKTRISDQSPRPDDGRLHFVGFLEKSIFYYKDGHHKQYILVDTIFNYIFHFGIPGTYLYLSPRNTPFWCRRSRCQKGARSVLV